MESPLGDLGVNVFAELYGPDEHPAMPDWDLVYFWETPGAQEISQIVWDTGVPAVTDRWPHHDYEPIGVKEHMKLLLGVTDTSVLYQKTQLLDLLEVTA